MDIRTMLQLKSCISTQDDIPEGENIFSLISAFMREVKACDPDDQGNPPKRRTFWKFDPNNVPELAHRLPKRRTGYFAPVRSFISGKVQTLSRFSDRMVKKITPSCVSQLSVTAREPEERMQKAQQLLPQHHYPHSVTEPD